MFPGSVSVVIPTHNRRERVLRAVASVYAQTTRPLEVIVVDDGSEDGTARALRTRFPSVRILRQPNHGVSRARNRGIAAAHGEWIAFLDSDDEWVPQKLERQLAALVHHPGHWLCHTDEIWIRHGKRVNQMKKHAKGGGRQYMASLPLCVISPSAAVIHRDAFEQIGTFDESLPACEDYDLWLRFTSRFPVVFVAEPLVIKRGGHQDQLSRRYPAMDRFRIRALAKQLTSPHLTTDELQATRATMERKIQIFRQGAAKRGKFLESKAFDDLLEVRV